MTRLEELEAVVTKRTNMYRSMAFRMLRHQDDAEDAVQDAFLLAFKNIDRFRGTAEMGTWVGSIVRNCCLMRLRNAKRRCRIAVDEFFDMTTLQAETPDIIAEIDGERLERRVRTVIASLPEHMRLTLTYRLEGLKLAEIGREMHVSEGSIKAYASRARVRLSERLGL